MFYVDKECEIWWPAKANSKLDQLGYGAWLQALPYNPGKISFTTISGMRDGYGRTQSGSLGPKALHVHESFLQHPVTATPSDHYPHSGDTNVDNSQTSVMANSNFVEDLTRSLNARIKSNKEAIDIIPNITPSVSQFSTFKSHINEIDVAVKKFESNNTPLPVTSQTEFTLPIIIDFGEIFQEKIVIALMIPMKKIFLRKYPHVTLIHPWALQYPVSGKNLHASILLVTLVCTKLF